MADCFLIQPITYFESQNNIVFLYAVSVTLQYRKSWITIQSTSMSRYIYILVFILISL